MSTYLYVGTHADTLDTGAPIAPYQEVELTKQQLSHPHIQALLDDNLLQEIKQRKTTRVKAEDKTDE